MKIALLLGGPSLKGVNVSAIKADAVVGVNWSFLYRRVDYNVVCDYRLMDRIQSDVIVKDPETGDEDLAVHRYQEFLKDGGMNFFVDHAQQRTTYGGSFTVPSTYPKWPQYPQLVVDGLYCRSNVGLSGLSLACLLMPSKGEIEIYGLDLNRDTPDGNTENWHQNHDPRWSVSSNVYSSMVDEFDEAKKKIPNGIHIRNMNPKSAYRGFDFE
jgi:hypothetical protein